MHSQCAYTHMQRGMLVYSKPVRVYNNTADEVAARGARRPSTKNPFSLVGPPLAMIRSRFGSLAPRKKPDGIITLHAYSHLNIQRRTAFVGRRRTLRGWMLDITIAAVPGRRSARIIREIRHCCVS